MMFGPAGQSELTKQPLLAITNDDIAADPIGVFRSDGCVLLHKYSHGDTTPSSFMTSVVK
jgi:hypothetical protein